LPFIQLNDRQLRNLLRLGLLFPLLRALRQTERRQVLNRCLLVGPVGVDVFVRRQDRVTGPATSVPKTRALSQTNPGIMNVKITYNSSPPYKKVVVAPGMGNVLFEMEGSTNMVNWAPATNGIYGGTNSAYLFRIKLTK